MTQERTEEDTNTSGFNDPIEGKWIELIEVTECDSDSLIWIRNKNETRKDLRIRAPEIQNNIDLYLNNGWVKFQLAIEFDDSEPETERQSELIKGYKEEYQELVQGVKKSISYTCSDGLEFQDLAEANKHQSILLKVFNIMKNQNIEGGKEVVDAVFKLAVAGFID